MFRWIFGVTRWDKIRNGNIVDIVGVTSIVKNVVENRFRWFGHVERKPVDSILRRVDQIDVSHIIRGIRRGKIIIRETIRNDL